jgi:hypothetical protein
VGLMAEVQGRIGPPAVMRAENTTPATASGEQPTAWAVNRFRQMRRLRRRQRCQPPVPTKSDRA